MQHVYKGYKNLCNRVIDPKATTIQGSVVKNASHVLISQSASQRFERLSDRIEILILSEMEEFTAEKESLISTVLSLISTCSQSLTSSPVLQYQCPERLRSHSSIDTFRNASSEAQRALPSRELSYQLFLNADQRSSRHLYCK